MKYIKRFILDFLVLILTAALLAGCKKGNTGSNTVPLPVQKGESKKEPAAGGTLRIPMNASPESLHPLFARQAQTRNLLSMVFEPLITFDENMEPAACLTESWKYNEEDNTWVFKLRNNVHWHGDLGEVTASDAAYTVNSILANPESVFYPSVSYFVSSAEGYDTTLVIHPKVNSYLLVYAMNIPVIPEKYYSGKNKNTKDAPMGSGCFNVESLSVSSETKMTLTAFEKWWKKLPNISRVEATGYSSTKDIMEAFTSGNLDCVPTSVRTTEIYEILDGVNKQNYLSRNYLFLGFNLSRGITANVDFRKAIAYGINKTDIINNVYLTKASGTEQPLYNDSSLTSAKVTMYDHNVTRAKEFLVGLEDTDSDGRLEYRGQNINLTLAVVNDTEDPVRIEAAETVKKNLESLGIGVTINGLTSDEMKSAAAKKDFDLILSGYSLSEVPLLRFAFSPSGEGNLFSYSSSAMNDVLNRIDSAKTLDETKSAMLEFQTVCAADLPQIGLFFEMNTFLYRDGLHVEGIRRESNVYASINSWYFIKE